MGNMMTVKASTRLRLALVSSLAAVAAGVVAVVAGKPCRMPVVDAETPKGQPFLFTSHVTLSTPMTYLSLMGDGNGTPLRLASGSTVFVASVASCLNDLSNYVQLSMSEIAK